MPWLWAFGCGGRPRTGARSETQGEEEEVAHITSHTPPIQQSPVWRGEGEEWRGGGGGEVDGAMKSPGRGILCGSWHEKVQYLLARASPVSSGMRKSSIFWHEKPMAPLASSPPSASSTPSRSTTSTATITTDVFNASDTNGQCPASVYDSVE